MSVRFGEISKRKKNVRETLVSGLLRDGERFTCKGSLVDGDVDGLGKTTVGGNDITNLERDHVTGNETGGLVLGPLAVTLDLGLGGERVHEGLDGVTGVALLVETDTRVDEEKEDDTDEILPIRSATFTIGQGDGDEGGGFHDPGERVPHEREELRNAD